MPGIVVSGRRREILDAMDVVAERAPRGVNRVLANTRKLFSWAVERDLIEASPVAAVKAPAPETARDRVLTEGELRAFWRACAAVGEPFGTIGKLLLLTGQRRDEVSAAPWAEFDLDAGMWELPGSRTKNGRAHRVPLPGLAVEIIEEIPRRSVLLFPASFSRIERGPDAPDRPVSGFGRAKERLDAEMAKALRKEAEEEGRDPAKATLVPWRLHDLRRSAATGMAGLGIAPAHIEAVLNHVSGTVSGVAGIYNRWTYEDEKRAALKAWAAHVAEIVKD